MTQEDSDYGAKVVAKQTGCSLAEANAEFGKLPAAKKEALVSAGRRGKLGECRELLGVDDEE